jgi:hypothetical protein
VIGAITAGLFSAGVAPVTNSYESIATVSLSGTQSTISFSSIPSTYKHLQLRGIGLSNAANQRDVWVTLNSDSGANYSWHRLTGNGSVAESDAGASANYMILARVSESGVSNLGAFVIDILDYADTNKYKTARSLAGRDANGSGSVWLDSGSWRSTSAVNSISLKPQSDSWNQYSHIALYGIKG